MEKKELAGNRWLGVGGDDNGWRLGCGEVDKVV